MRRPKRSLVLIILVTALLVATSSVYFLHARGKDDTSSRLPLQAVGSLTLPGDNSRFDYASLDPARHLLFIAHLGAGELIEVDTETNTVVRVIPHLDGVHGVLVIPALRRVFATATNSNQVVTLDEETGTVLGRASTGAYPDGLAYDPARNRVWVTNESGGSETVLDVASGRIAATVDVGGDAGNVAYDPGSSTSSGADRIFVDVQSRNEVAIIDPATFTVTRRISVPGCDHPHGLALDPPHRLGFVACDGNATLHSFDLDTLAFADSLPVGDSPDVLALDPVNGWLYVAGEAGTVTILAERGRTLTILGSDHLADGAHVVAVDPTTHRSYYPIPGGTDGRPELLVRRPMP